MHVDLEKIISSKSSIKMIYILEDSYPCLFRKHCCKYEKCKEKIEKCMIFLNIVSWIPKSDKILNEKFDFT